MVCHVNITLGGAHHRQPPRGLTPMCPPAAHAHAPTHQRAAGRGRQREDVVGGDAQLALAGDAGVLRPPAHRDDEALRGEARHAARGVGRLQHVRRDEAAAGVEVDDRRVAQRRLGGGVDAVDVFLRFLLGGGEKVEGHGIYYDAVDVFLHFFCEGGGEGGKGGERGRGWCQLGGRREKHQVVAHLYRLHHVGPVVAVHVKAPPQRVGVAERLLFFNGRGGGGSLGGARKVS